VIDHHAVPEVAADFVPRSQRGRRSGGEPGWLSLGPASRLLGVDPGTLRRWADAGRVEAFTTPGGHRRFARRSLERLSASRREARHGVRPPLARLGATPGRVNAAYRRSYVTHEADGSPSHLAPIDQTERSSYRHDGRQLVELLLQYLDAPNDAARTAAETAASALAAEFARRVAHAGISLTEGVWMFVAGRRPFLSELGGVARRRGLASAQLAALYESASDLLDRLLLRFVETYRAEAVRG
jgi:excisionase family DNA binding protein